MVETSHVWWALLLLEGLHLSRTVFLWALLRVRQTSTHKRKKAGEEIEEKSAEPVLFSFCTALHDFFQLLMIKFYFQFFYWAERWSFSKVEASGFSVLLITCWYDCKWLTDFSSAGCRFQVSGLPSSTEFHHESLTTVPQLSCLLFASSELPVPLGSYFRLPSRCFSWG